MLYTGFTVGVLTARDVVARGSRRGGTGWRHFPASRPPLPLVHTATRFGASYSADSRPIRELAGLRLLDQLAELPAGSAMRASDFSSPSPGSALPMPRPSSASDVGSVCASSSSVEAGATAKESSVAQQAQQEQMQVDGAIMATGW